MTSKLLDYLKPAKKTRFGTPPMQVETRRVAGEMELGSQTLPAPTGIATDRVYKGPLDYPAITDWLKACEADIERGRDKHGYSTLAPMFEANGCTRIDDITRMSTDLLSSLATNAGLSATIGLINRVHQYAKDDVEKVKTAGRLIL